MEGELDVEHSYILTGHGIMDGVYVDTPTDYGFVDEGSPYYEDTMLWALDLGIVQRPFNPETFDANTEPYCYVINALCKRFRSELDTLSVGDA